MWSSRARMARSTGPISAIFLSIRGDSLTSFDMSSGAARTSTGCYHVSCMRILSRRT